MTDLKQRLREGDPVQHEGPLHVDDRDRMRRAILAASRPQLRADTWPRPWLVAAAVSLAVASGLFAGTRLPRRDAGVVSSDFTKRADEPRQVQFETKGGTRVIWILNPAFDLGKDPAP